MLVWIDECVLIGWMLMMCDIWCDGFIVLVDLIVEMLCWVVVDVVFVYVLVL